MITVKGTSHISQESVNEIRQLVEEENPDVIAIELDPARLNSLMNQEKKGSFYLIPWFMRRIQKFLGKKTGIAPGSEMIEAVKTAKKERKDIALIDQDIRYTMYKIMKIPLKEKLKFGFSLLGSLFLPLVPLPNDKIIQKKDFNLNEVPDQELIEFVLSYFEIKFPELFHILVEERNQIMAARLKELDQKYDKILALVGAGHVKGINQLLAK